MVQVATDEAEGAQALFCYIADILGAKKTIVQYKPYLTGRRTAGDFFAENSEIVNEAFSKGAVKTGKSKDQIIKYIKGNEGWFISSLKISQYIIENIADISSKFKKIQKPGWQNLLYRHADDEIMSVMSLLFKSANMQYAKANGTKAFGDINKWTPADIYFASPKAKKTFKDLSVDNETKKNNLTFSELNESIGDMITSGDLLPLSLKKADKDVIVKKVNFSRKDEEKLLADTVCTGVQKWNPMKGSFGISGKNFIISAYSGGRDIRVLIKSGGQIGDLQFRHTPASNGKPSKGFKTVLSYKGSSALGGQVVGIPILTNLIEQVNTTFASKVRSIFANKYAKFEAAMKDYNEKGGGIERYNSGSKELKNQFNNDVGALSALTIMNPLRIEIDNFFKNKSKTRDNVVRAIFAYTASRTVNSAPFVIAKD